MKGSGYAKAKAIGAFVFGAAFLAAWAWSGFPVYKPFEKHTPPRYPAPEEVAWSKCELDNPLSALRYVPNPQDVDEPTPRDICGPDPMLYQSSPPSTVKN